ncbi:sulfite exporter TauE/SafE family protein [Verrucomicrobiaceae bacterium 227]
MLGLDLPGYLAIFVMGVTLGVIGAGGSILTVPILVYLFAVEPTLATAYSLVLVGATAATGGVKCLMREGIDREAFLVFGLPSVLSVYLVRRFLLPAIPDQLGSVGGFEITRDGLIMLVFAVLMLAAAFMMIFGRVQEVAAAREPTLSRRILAGLEGIVVGGITGLVGAGGGFLIVPVMIWLLNLPVRVAVSTSLLVIAVKSLIGFLGDLQGSQVIDWRFLAGLLVLSSIGVLVGVGVGRKISSNHLKRGFGWFVLVIGVIIITQELSG